MDERGRGWKPVLEGDAAAAATEAIRAIAGALETIGPAVTPGLDGAAGTALFYAYLAEQGGRERDGELADETLERAVDGVAETLTAPSLFAGFAGVAWVVEHLVGSDGGAGDLNAEIDEVLAAAVRADRWRGRHDLISGLAGVALYLVERLPRPPAAAALAALVDHLGRAAERDGDGARWLTPAAELPERQRARAPDGYFNLGVAHGAPGVAVALARAARADIPGAADLARDALAWIARCDDPDAGGSRLPRWITAGGAREASRTAWCYGDLGAALALSTASAALGEDRWRERAIELGLAAAAREPSAMSVADAGLCHGAAGLGHMFNRLWQATGEPRLAAAARFWFAEALSMRRPGAGIGGFTSHMPRRDPPAQPDRTLLSGVPGIGLALLAATGSLEPAWDRLFALSGEPAEPT